MREINETKESKLFTLKLFVGIYLLSITFGVPYIWGNINVYTMSYFHFRVNIETQSASSWILALNALAWGIGILAGSYSLSKAWFGFRVAIIGSTVVFSLSMSLCYFAVQTSFVFLNILLGIVCGFTFGLSQCLETKLITIWADPKKLGLALCSVMLTQQIGIIIMSLILTRFVNPGNIKPDVVGLGFRMFSQPEILDKVPYMYIVYGGIAFGTGLLASVLVWSSTPKRIEQQNARKSIIKTRSRLVKKTDPRDFNSSKKYNATRITVQNNATTQFPRDLDDSITDTMNKQNEDQKTKSKYCRHMPPGYTLDAGQELESTLEISMWQTKANSLTKTETVTAKLPVEFDENIGEELVHESQHNIDSSPSNFNLKQVLKSKTFYVLVMMGAYADVSCTILNTYYKMFGLINYPDDDFFTAMGLWMNVGAIIATWLSGMACDKFSVKNTVIANTTILCLVSAVFYLSARINKWLYLVLGVIFNGCTLSVYILVSVSASAYFDKQNTTTVLGMALISLFITGTALPPVATYTLSNFGWLYLFTLVCVFILAGLFIVVLGLGSVTNNKDHKDKGIEIR